MRAWAKIKIVTNMKANFNMRRQTISCNSNELVVHLEIVLFPNSIER